MTRGNFYFNKKNSVDGFTPYCITCTKKKSAKWIKENPEKHREHLKVNRATEKGKETKNRTDKQFRESETYQRWKKNNGENFRKYRIKRELTKKHDISDEEWKDCKEYFSNSCAYCGLHIDDHFVPRKGKLINSDLHREHVEDKGANDLSNCVPACQSCNSRKWINEFKEWYSKQNSFTRERMERIEKWLLEDYKLFIKSS